MGAWGPGLYSNDFACDLKSTIRAVSRLPYEPKKILELLCEMEEDTASNPLNEDYTTFWLVVADQFYKKGIYLKHLNEKAIKIIDKKQDLHMLSDLGMEDRDLKKREKTLQKLKSLLCNQANEPSKKRKTLKAPLPFIMEVGDCFSFPTSNGLALNPYVSKKDAERYYNACKWKQNGYGLLVVCERGRVLDYLTWYRVLVMDHSPEKKPSFSKELLIENKWSICEPGVFTNAMVKNCSFEKLGNIQFKEEKLDQIFPNRKNPYWKVLDNIGMGFCSSVPNDCELDKNAQESPCPGTSLFE
ncbi:MAG: hypothetical protein SNF33_02625 [Candidatus Algichlamydia australiensis]|nr:hypothetical protein [Chlamydiales bacterium]